jgi:hypothetical protein
MMNARETSSKLYSAVSEMACSEATLRQRLIDAFSDLFWVDPLVLPEEISSRFADFKARMAIDGKKVNETINAMSDDEVRRCIRLVCEVHDEMAQSIGPE